MQGDGACLPQGLICMLSPALLEEAELPPAHEKQQPNPLLCFAGVPGLFFAQ